MDNRIKLTESLGATAANAVLREAPHGVPIAVFSSDPNETVTAMLAEQLREMDFDAIGLSEMRGSQSTSTKLSEATDRNTVTKRDVTVRGCCLLLWVSEADKQ